jgi:hypothetical protein
LRGTAKYRRDALAGFATTLDLEVSWRSARPPSIDVSKARCSTCFASTLFHRDKEEVRRRIPGSHLVWRQWGISAFIIWRRDAIIGRCRRLRGRFGMGAALGGRLEKNLERQEPGRPPRQARFRYSRNVISRFCLRAGGLSSALAGCGSNDVVRPIQPKALRKAHNIWKTRMARKIASPEVATRLSLAPRHRRTAPEITLWSRV